MGDYDYELVEIRKALEKLLVVMEDIRDKMPPQEGDYSIVGGGYS